MMRLRPLGRLRGLAPWGGTRVARVGPEGVVLSGDPPATSAATPTAAGAAAALGELLGRARIRRLAVIVADRWVRYCVVPSGAGLWRAADQAAWARHAFAAEYGAAALRWQVRVDSDAAGTGFAALIDDALVAAIGEAAARAGVRLVSLQPHFAATQARLAARWRARDAWLAVAADGWLTGALRAGGTWRHVTGTRLAPGAGGEEVAAALAAGSLGIDAARAVRLVHLAGHDVAPRGVPAGWVLRPWLDPVAQSG